MDLDTKKPVCILAQGPSIAEFIDLVEEIDRDRFYFASLNRFSIIDDYLDSKSVKPIDIVYCSSTQRFAEEAHNLCNWNGFFITNREVSERCYKLGITPNFTTDFAYGLNSLTAMIVALLRIGLKKFYLFGCDGGNCSGNHVYFDQEKYEGENIPARKQSIERDTYMMNKIFWHLIDYWQIYPEFIKNVNPASKITAFEKIKFGEFLYEQQSI